MSLVSLFRSVLSEEVQFLAQSLNTCHGWKGQIPLNCLHLVPFVCCPHKKKCDLTLLKLVVNEITSHCVQCCKNIVGLKIMDTWL